MKMTPPPKPARGFPRRPLALALLWVACVAGAGRALAQGARARTAPDPLALARLWDAEHVDLRSRRW